MGGAQVLGLVHHDVAIAVAQPAAGGVLQVDVVEPTRFLPLPGDVPDALFTAHLQACRPLRHLVPGLPPEPVEPLGEAFGELPDLRPLPAADALAAPGPPGTEVVGAAADRLAEDDLGPLLVQELRVPGVLTQFVEQCAPLAYGLAVVDGLLPLPGSASRTTRSANWST
nr:hypothetical protein [Streptomyces tirandamycinicus]